MIESYRLATAQGDAYSQFNMGYAYGNGEGVDIDVVEGMKWMKLASENGFPQAIKFLESSRSSHHSPPIPLPIQNKVE